VIAVRVRRPDWLYSSHGPYLVTRHWLDGRSETHPEGTLESALHRALHWHTVGPDQAVAVVDGWGEFVFARAAHLTPDGEDSRVSTLECYELLMGTVPHEEASTMFSGIEPS
jgi:hypothetical protein